METVEMDLLQAQICALVAEFEAIRTMWIKKQEG